MLNMRQMGLAMQRQGRSFLGRIAEAEGRRRLIIAAIVLERYRIRHGSYPATLQELIPEMLASAPIDFMDGRPLRYQRGEDGRFLLYSVGLDCVDNGGQMWVASPMGVSYVTSELFDNYVTAGRPGFRPGPDLVWPRVASDADAEKVRHEQHKAQADRQAQFEDDQANEQWERTARRQAKVESILKARSRGMPKEAAVLAQTLHNESASGTNNITLNEMLTLKQVIAGAEPEIVTFELPISYDALTNLGSLQLYIDPCKDDESDEGCNVGQLECNRATNGNCLLLWNTIYECPGKHALQAGLTLNDRPLFNKQTYTPHLVYNDPREVFGPVTPFALTNLCQFSLSSAHFQHEYGVTLKARLPEANGDYVLEIKSPVGELVRTLKGKVADGVIDVHWDLTDERGKTCTNEAFDTVFHITLPDSGRSQTIKGP